MLRESCTCSIPDLPALAYTAFLLLPVAPDAGFFDAIPAELEDASRRRLDRRLGALIHRIAAGSTGNHRDRVFIAADRRMERVFFALMLTFSWRARHCR